MTATSQARPTSLTWRALGTYVYLATADPAQLGPAQAMVHDVLAEVDRTCSRFRSDSDLMRANARPGRWVAVDRLLVAAVSVAVQAAEHTDGLVDPCLGRSMVQLGYDADLEEVRRRPSPYTTDPAAPWLDQPRATADPTLGRMAGHRPGSRRSGACPARLRPRPGGHGEGMGGRPGRRDARRRSRLPTGREPGRGHPC